MFQKKIKILLDADILINCARKAGIYYTALNILKCLLERNDVEVALFVNNFNGPRIEELNSLIDKKIRYEELDNWFFVSYLRYLRTKFRDQKKYLLKFLIQILLYLFSPFKKLYKYFYRINIKKYKIFLSPIYKIDNYNYYNKSLKKYLVLYDTTPLIYPEYFLPSQDPNFWYNQVISSLNEKDYYFTISKNSYQDFLKYCPIIKPENMKTTLLACNDNFKPASEEKIAEVKAKYNINKKYVFSLCTLEPRKNLIMAVKTFIKFIQKNNIDDMVFVLGGTQWDEFIEKLETKIENLGDYKNKILRLGYVPDEDLAPLYSGSEWFVYTSQYEGFGLPPLEAMSCGCPVITSNNSSLPEVVGDAGIMIDYDSDEQHIKAYEKYYYNPELRKEYAQKGLERAKQFSWGKCVDEMVTTMKENYEK